MKKLFFLFSLLMAVTFTQTVEAQNRYGQTTFALDTLTNSETVYYTLPGSYGDDKLQDMATWQVRVKNLTDTISLSIFMEETVDEDSSPDYVVVDTIVSAASSVGANTLSYLKHYAIRGKKQRLRVVAVGTSATSQIEVDAWVRNKVPFTLTDEQ